MATASTPALPSRPLVLADLVPAVRARNVALVALGVASEWCVAYWGADFLAGAGTIGADLAAALGKLRGA